MKKKPIIEEEWIEVGTFSTVDETISLEYLKQYLKDNIPENITDKDIHFRFEGAIEYGYYDECFAAGKMIILYKNSKVSK